MSDAEIELDAWEHEDHRAIANRMALFHQQAEGPGMVFWHPRGFALYQVVEDYMRRHMRRAGFREIRTPQLLSRGLWERSGHWQKFGANMFAVDDGGQALALKPMSCPGHIQVFNKRRRSYRDLPMRLNEFGACHRNEPSGALNGLLRSRAFVQDDAHIFCSEAQIEAEVTRFCRLLSAIYRDFGFVEPRVGFATRPAVRAGSDAVWDQAEAALEAAAGNAGLKFVLDEGEGAFYGPKLDFALRDSRDRLWQCGTVQLDLVLPERLDVGYIDADGQRRRPVLLHQAVFGSLERFIGILLEHYQGKLPLWLAPEQVLVASVGTDQAVVDHAQAVAGELEEAGFRVAVDVSRARLARKIVDARQAGIARVAVIGPEEARDLTVSLRGQLPQPRSPSVARVIELLRPEAFR